MRCIEYLSRRKCAVAASYDRLLASTPGLDPWCLELEQLRARPNAYRHVDLGALVKHALALGRTFPERSTTLLYLYWEPLDAEKFEEFRHHRAEIGRLAETLRDARVAFTPQCFASLWQDWSARRSPAWLADHVLRLQARYDIRLTGCAGRS